jgi:hypothetical protein
MAHCSSNERADRRMNGKLQQTSTPTILRCVPWLQSSYGYNHDDNINLGPDPRRRRRGPMGRHTQRSRRQRCRAVDPTPSNHEDVVWRVRRPPEHGLPIRCHAANASEALQKKCRSPSPTSSTHSGCPSWRSCVRAPCTPWPASSPSYSRESGVNGPPSCAQPQRMLASCSLSRPRRTWIGDAEHHDMDALRDRHHEVAVTSTELAASHRPWELMAEDLDPSPIVTVFGCLAVESSIDGSSGHDGKLGNPIVRR